MGQLLNPTSKNLQEKEKEGTQPKYTKLSTNTKP